MTETLERLKPFLSQYDFGIGQLLERLEGLSDEEYFREPVPNCWSVRKREDATSERPFGKGNWVMDFGKPEGDPPFTTIAWRMTHMSSLLAQRAEYTIGNAACDPDDLDIPLSADDAIHSLEESAARWRGALESASEQDLDTVGYSALPWGLDPELPFIEIVWWVNKEVLHHAAEIALLRDLYRADTASSFGA
jgi:hypothetical protein